MVNRSIVHSVLACLAVVSFNAIAADKNWLCNDGSWDDAACWSPVAGQPSESDDAFLIQSDEVDRNVTYSNTAGPASKIHSLTINSTGSGTMTFSQNQGDFIDGFTYVGTDGAGIYNQSGGRHIVQGAFLGAEGAGSGTYNLTGGSLLTDVTNVGNARGGSGNFNQHAGSIHQTATALDIYKNGTYNLLGGLLDNANSAVNVIGTFNQSGGTNTGETPFFGLNVTGGGIYNLSGGTVDYAAANVVRGGVFNQTAGTSRFNTFSNDDGGLVVSSTYNLSDGILESNRMVVDNGGTFNLNSGTSKIEGITIIGSDGVATYNQNGGSHIANGMFLGTEDNGNATYNLTGGSLSTDVSQIGHSGSGVGIFNQNAGSTHQTSTALEIHENSTYNLFGGTLDNANSAVNVSGTFNQSGGNAFGLTSDFGLNVLGGGAYNLSGGTVEYAAANVTSGGVFSQTDGTSRFNTFSDEAGGLTISGTYNLSGGSLESNRMVVNNGGAFNFTGGTLAVKKFTGDLVNNGGTLAPGNSAENSPGVTQVVGNYTQASNAAYAVEIGGLAQGNEYDWLNVSGNATLAGTLEVDMFDLSSGSFTLGEGDVFDILSAETIIGRFDVLTLVALDDGLVWDVSYLTDATGSTDIVRLTVNGANTSPTANAGSDQLVNEGVAVSLNGNASSGADGEIASYIWTQTAGTNVTVIGADTAAPSFIAPSVISDTVLKFSLEVADSSGETDTDAVTISVTDVIVVDAGADQHNAEGETVQLSGLSSIGAGSYQWIQLEGTAVHLSNDKSATPNFAAPLVDVNTLLVFELLITDSNGAQDSDTTFVNIRDGLAQNVELPPLDVQLINTVATANSLYQFDTVSDPFFASANVSWSQINGPDVTLEDASTNVPSFVTHSLTADSAATFEVRSTDSNGLISRAKVSVNILSTDSVNIPPTANAGADQIVTEGEAVYLDATASIDSDGSIVSYYWQQTDSSLTDGSLISLSAINQAKTSFVAPAIAAVDDGSQLTFELVVTDDGGFVDRQSVTITVLDNGITAFADDVIAVINSSGDPIGIQPVAGGSLVALEAIDPMTIDDATNRPDSLPYGLLDFSLRVEPGATVNVSIALASPASANFTWWKYSEANGWQDYSANTTFNTARDVVTITITDNGKGDEDPTPGVIRDPGGIALASSSSTGGNSSSSSDGGSTAPLLLVFLLLIFITRTLSRVNLLKMLSSERIICASVNIDKEM